MNGPQATAMPAAAHTAPVAKETPAASSAFASCTRCRTGTHRSEARTLEVVYSPVTMSMARTTTANWTTAVEETEASPTGWTGCPLIRAIEP